MEKILLLANIAATLFLTGVIWTTQLVQYPFFAYFNADTFTKHHDDYRFRITPIVAPPMILELLTAVLLLFYPLKNIDSKLVWLALILTIAIWAATFFVQVPLHEKLARGGFDLPTIESLVKTNWIRTLLWSLRAALVSYLAWLALRP